MEKHQDDNLPTTVDFKKSEPRRNQEREERRRKTEYSRFLLFVTFVSSWFFLELYTSA